MNNLIGSSESQEEAGSGPLLPDDLRLGPVHLIVTDVDRSTDFYTRSIGLRVHSRSEDDGRRAVLGTGGEDLLVLHENPGAQPAGRHAGLYHFALLHPSRLELARAAQRLAATGTPIQGASDHGISEAIYLPDPDGNGIELAADRSRERWGDLRDPTTIGPAPLDMAGLLELVGEEPVHAEADPGLSIGHVHLYVGDVEEALALYRDIIGFELITHFDSAAFVSAGGYHHHLGVNVWRGVGVPPVPADSVGLDHWVVVIDALALTELQARLQASGAEHERDDELLRVADRWGNAMVFAPATR